MFIVLFIIVIKNKFSMCIIFNSHCDSYCLCNNVLSSHISTALYGVIKENNEKAMTLTDEI